MNETSRDCDLPFLDPNRDLVYFDIQAAEPGTFLVPGVVDLEIYKAGGFAVSEWLFFKGDPMAGPQPGHPFDMPFNNSVKWSIDLVEGNDTSNVIRQIMAPTNASLFWDGGAPFGRRGNHSMYMPVLDNSCKYYAIAAMMFRWPVPTDVGMDSDFRLKLMTDDPATTHISGRLQIAADAASSRFVVTTGTPTVFGVLTGHSISVVLSASLIFMLLLSCLVLRLRRAPARITLE